MGNFKIYSFKEARFSVYIKPVPQYNYDMNDITKEPGFNHIKDTLLKAGSKYGLVVHAVVAGARPESLKKHEYMVHDEPWTVYEGSTFKMTVNGSRSYSSFFDKTTGTTIRFGKTVDDDPEACLLGPEIADIEIVSGKCPKINGRNCAFCYKNNGGETANCMKLSEFKELLDFMPRNLTQIAFGITGVRTNPEFFDMMAYARASGVVPNYTTNGVDLDDEAIERTLDLCGRVAVSCYEGAKDLCYDTMRRVGEAAAKRGVRFPCNVHVVLSKATYGHVMDVLKDATEKKIPNLGAIVVLRIKPVGRAAGMDCSIPFEYYENIVKFCIGSNVPFGFDSCGGAQVEKALKAAGREDLVYTVDRCESSRLSSYFNWKREYWSCSFCENNPSIMEAADPFKYPSFVSFWNSPELARLRFPACRECESCAWYRLDA